MRSMPVSEDGRCPVGADSGKTVAGLSGRGEMWGAAAWGSWRKECSRVRHASIVALVLGSSARVGYAAAVVRSCVRRRSWSRWLVPGTTRGAGYRMMLSDTLMEFVALMRQR